METGDQEMSSLTLRAAKRSRHSKSPPSPASEMAQSMEESLNDADLSVLPPTLVRTLARMSSSITMMVDSISSLEEKNTNLMDRVLKLEEENASLKAKMIAAAESPDKTNTAISDATTLAKSIGLTSTLEENAEIPFNVAHEIVETVERNRSLVFGNLLEDTSLAPQAQADRDVALVAQILNTVGVSAKPVSIYRMGRFSHEKPRLLKVVMPSSKLQQFVLKNSSYLYNSCFRGVFIRKSLSLAERKNMSHTKPKTYQQTIRNRGPNNSIPSVNSVPNLHPKFFPSPKPIPSNTNRNFC